MNLGKNAAPVMAATALALWAVCGSAAQNASVEKKYVGEWTAQLNGKVYARVEFHVAEGKLVGGMSTGDVTTDAKGEVSKVNEEAGEPAAVFDVAASETSLRFKRKDGDDVDSFELKITGPERAELVFVLPEGAPKEGAPKPFKMVRKH